MTGLFVFVVTYVLISLRRLNLLGFDRPAGALLGAVACVALGVLSPAEALSAIDGNTLLLLLGVMGMGAHLSMDGLFDTLENHAARWARTPARLLGGVVWASGLLSALITNDAVCVLGAPLLVKMIQRQKLPPLPFLLALATSANTGSVATLVGNPQNMLCALLGNLSYREHLGLMGPLALLALGFNHALLHLGFRKSLKGNLGRGTPAAPLPRKAWLTLGVIAGTAIAYTLGAHLSWTAMGGFVLLMLLHRNDTRLLWPRIDGSILLFFCGLFVVAEGFMKSGLPQALFHRFPLSSLQGSLAGNLGLSGVFLLGSNLVSNVPFILLVKEAMKTLPQGPLGWEMLAMASTFAGNLTLLGSVANIIVAESGREVGGLGFWEHFKVGFPLAMGTTLLGTLWLQAFAH